MDFLNCLRPKLWNSINISCKSVLDIKNNITPGLTIKDLILNSFKEIKANIKQLQDDIKEMNDGFIPVTNQNVSGSVTNNLLKLEKEHLEH